MLVCIDKFKKWRNRMEPVKCTDCKRLITKSLNDVKRFCPAIDCHISLAASEQPAPCTAFIPKTKGKKP